MSTGVFLLKEDKSLGDIKQEEPLTKENLLNLLEKDLERLVKDQSFNPIYMSKLLYIAGKNDFLAPKPDDKNQSFIDLVFLDIDGVLVLVKIIDSTDSENHVKIIGEIIDFTTFSTPFWSTLTIKKIYESRCKKEGKNPIENLKECLQLTDTDNFWRQVENKIKNERAIIIIAGNKIDPNILSMIEFLNNHLYNIELAALEVKQFSENNSNFVFSRIFGQTFRKRVSMVREDKYRDILSEMRSAEESKEKVNQEEVPDYSNEIYSTFLQYFSSNKWRWGRFGNHFDEDPF